MLSPSGTAENSSWNIDYFYDNYLYGREDEFPIDPSDPNFRIDPEHPNHRIHKAGFEGKELSFTIAHFLYDNHEPYWEVHFIGNRPIENLTTPEMREAFWELLKYGDEMLNNEEDE